MNSELCALCDARRDTTVEVFASWLVKIVLAIFIGLALFLSAQALAADRIDRTSRGDALRRRNYATQAALTLYVDPTGSDSGGCTASGTSACLTIQGALGKVPKLIRHRVTINVAAGNYAGFIVSGFTQDQTVNQTTGGLYILGTLANATVATGSASGTATSGTAGSAQTFGTLTDSTQTWTTNDLVGKWVVISSGTGSGQTVVISSNTTDTITVVGTWTAPGATSVYAIQEPSSVITSGTSPVPRGNQTTAGTSVAMGFVGNSVRDLGGIYIQNMAVSGTMSQSAYVYGGSAPTLDTVKQTRPSGTGAPFIHSGAGTLYLYRSYSALTVQTAGSQLGVHLVNEIAGLAEGYRLYSFGSLFVNGQWAMYTTTSSSVFSNSEARQTDRGLEFLRSGGSISSSRITCAGAQGQWGIAVGERHDGATASASVSVYGVHFENCWYGIEQGGGNLYLQNLTGLTGASTLDLRGGGKVTLDTDTGTGFQGSDGGLYDFQIDAYGGTSPVYGAWSDFLGVGDGGTVGSCIGTLAGASSICTQP